jgi:hypothetical protein
MILRRFLETVLSALGWLVDMLFPQVIVLTVLLVAGLAALLLLLIVRRARMRDVSTIALPSVEIAAAAGEPNRPRA